MLVPSCLPYTRVCVRMYTIHFDVCVSYNYCFTRYFLFCLLLSIDRDNKVKVFTSVGCPVTALFYRIILMKLTISWLVGRCAVAAVPARRALRGRGEQLHVRVRGHRVRRRRLLPQHRRVRAAAVPTRWDLHRRCQRLPLQLLSGIQRFVTNQYLFPILIKSSYFCHLLYAH